MNPTTDPILLLRELRSDVPPPTAAAESRARNAMLAPGRARRPGLVAVAAAALAALAAVVVVAVSPWTHTQSAEAAVDQLVKTAAAQPTVKIGPHDWIITKYTVLRSWTQDLTQAKLDAITANLLAAANVPETSHVFHADGSPETKKERAATDRANQKRIARIRKGVKISELPTTHIEYTNEAPWVSARSASGGGGGGGGSNVIHYGSPEQKAAAKILKRAEIGGLASDPGDMGGSEVADLPLRGVSDEADVEKLSPDATTMRRQLAGWKGPLGLDEKAGSPRDLFIKSAGVVLSPYATPGQRAAAIRLTATLPGVQLAREAQDSKGRKGVGMSLPAPGGTMQLVFDTDSSQLLGVQTKVDDPVKFIGNSYVGFGKDRVRLIPRFDTATIGVSYEPVTVKRDGPPCSRSFCIGGGGPWAEKSMKRMRPGSASR